MQGLQQFYYDIIKIDKKTTLGSILIDQVKCRFVCEDYLIQNQIILVLFFVTQHTEGQHDTIQGLMKRHNSLTINNHSIICQEFLCLKLIHQSYYYEGNISNQLYSFLLNIYVLKGYAFIK